MYKGLQALNSKCFHLCITRSSKTWCNSKNHREGALLDNPLQHHTQPFSTTHGSSAPHTADQEAKLLLQQPPELPILYLQSISIHLSHASIKGRVGRGFQKTRSLNSPFLLISTPVFRRTPPPVTGLAQSAGAGY